MDLKRSSLLARLYFWSLLQARKHAQSWCEEDAGTDICTVFRRVLFILPFQILSIIVLSSCAVLAVIFLIGGGLFVMYNIYQDILWYEILLLIDGQPAFILGLTGCAIAIILTLHLFLKTETGLATVEYAKSIKGRYCAR